MNSSAKLLLVALLTAGSAGWLAYSGSANSWQYYVTAEECLRDADALVGKRLRVNGRIAGGSLAISADRDRATFEVVGGAERIHVTCPGPLPDNLRDEMDVVVEGVLENRSSLRGTSVLTRCASKYEPVQRGGDSSADALPARDGHE